ncbi:ASKHA domain-containing protein [Desulfosporosinus fructosivorans]|uniref:ASKHA domain-containing protein n=1 Tax=Desulfosporosinus fructosivorans TaxID=2018669 RepID=UPI001FB0E8BD|nr:ASKHA domain-containing protein [Desulfosporosinus fructosivorans]
MHRNSKFSSIKPAKCTCYPNIAGFVGADTVVVLLTIELDRSEEIKLVIDIGTNGEIALGSRNKIVAYSAAAGPVFEGAQISSGMRGAVGARSILASRSRYYCSRQIYYDYPE